MKHTRKVPIVVMTAVALTMTACAQSDRDSGNTASSGGASGTKDTFTFGAAGAPKLFDPLYATDGETFRVTRQIHSGLLGVKDGTADVEPDLAESFEPSADGLSWTFKLRQGVKFSDGTPFDAEAVCYNMDRMFNQKGAGQTAAEYWGYFFGTLQRQARGLAVQVVRGQGPRDRRHQHHPVHLELPDDPVARLLLDAVADRAQGR